jgi:hypothetical protein
VGFRLLRQLLGFKMTYTDSAFHHSSHKRHASLVQMD